MVASSKSSIRSTSSSDTITVHSDCENREIVEWLSLIDFRETQRVILHGRALGTGLEPMQSEKYRRWRDGDTKMLWMPGLPAAGKTMTAAGLVNDLDEYFKDSNVAVVCAFCDFRQSNIQSTKNLLSAMLRQIVESCPVVPPTVASLYEYHSSKSSFPRFDEIVATFSAVAQGFNRIFVIVDALDECLDDQTRSLLTHTLSSFSVNLLFTSRPDPSIEQIFEGWTRLDIHASQHDLRIYAEQRFELSRLVQQCGVDLKQKILEQVVQKADGMFVLARLHLDALMNVSKIGEALEVLENVPSGVHRTYEKTMQRISSASNPETTRLALCSLLWVTFARRVLVISELQEVINIMSKPTADTSQNLEHRLSIGKESVISACAGLIEVEENTAQVRLIHYTAYEYIIKEQRALWSNVQHHMAVACLSYLRCILPNLNCGTGGFIEEEILATARKHPFFSYALQEWGHHVHDCGELELVDDVLELLACDTECSLGRMLTYDTMRSPKCTPWSAMHFCAYFDLPATCEQIIKQHETPLKRASRFLTSFLKLKSRRQSAHRPMVFLDAQDDYDKSPLTVAASRGSIGVVRVLLNHEDHIKFGLKDYHLRTPLSYAAEGGSMEVTRLLLKRCSTPDMITSKDIFGRTVLFYAVDSRCVELVSLLVSHEDIELNAEDRSGRTPLSYAAQYGYSDVVKALLDGERIDVNQRDALGLSPLLYASMEGHEAVTRILLERKEILVNCLNSQGRSSLSLAAQRGHENVVCLLLGSSDVDVNLTDLVGRTPLSYSAQYGRVSIARSLLSRQKDVLIDLRDNSGRTPLSYGAEQGDGRMVLLLLNAGANHNSTDTCDLTPLGYAAEQKNRTTVELLFACPTISLKTKPGERSLLSYAAAYGWTALVKDLVEHPDININSQNHHGMHALAYASQEGHHDIVRLLLARKDVYFNSKDKQGRTALAHAAHSGHEPVIKQLISVPGILLNEPDNSGRLPLHHAASNGHSGVIRVLFGLEDLDVNHADIWGATPLMCAAMSGHFEAVCLFLNRRGVDVWALDNQQRTILSYAAQQGHTDILDILLSRGDAAGIPDSRDNDGRTPLSYAAQNGKVDAVKRLLQCPEVDPNARDFVNSVFEYAAEGLAKGRGGREARKSYIVIMDMLSSSMAPQAP